MKRKTIIGLITILSLALLTGCGKEIKEAGTGGKISGAHQKGAPPLFRDRSGDADPESEKRSR